MANKLFKQSTLSISIKDMDMKLGIVTGYFASFNTLDSDNDTILPGAFSKTIQEQGPDATQPRIKHLLNHDTDMPLGKLMILKEDAQGLYYESKVGSHALGEDFMKMVDSGLITEHSIGYSVVKKTVVNPDADWRDQQTSLHELKLYEGSSLTCWGANKNTPLTGVKAFKEARTKELDRLQKLMKAIENGTFTDTTFVFLLDELKYLQHILSDESTQPEPITVATQPNEEKEMLDQIAVIRTRIALAV